MKALFGLFAVTILFTGSFAQASTMCPDGQWVSAPQCVMCPDGNWYGGSSCTMLPNGSWTGQ